MREKAGIKHDDFRPVVRPNVHRTLLGHSQFSVSVSTNNLAYRTSHHNTALDSGAPLKTRFSMSSGGWRKILCVKHCALVPSLRTYSIRLPECPGMKSKNHHQRLSMQFVFKTATCSHRFGLHSNINPTYSSTHTHLPCTPQSLSWLSQPPPRHIPSSSASTLITWTKENSQASVFPHPTLPSRM